MQGTESKSKYVPSVLRLMPTLVLRQGEFSTAGTLWIVPSIPHSRPFGKARIRIIAGKPHPALRRMVRELGARIPNLTPNSSRRVSGVRKPIFFRCCQQFPKWESGETSSLTLSTYLRIDKFFRRNGNHRAKPTPPQGKGWARSG